MMEFSIPLPENFRGLTRWEEVKISHRNLPHWRLKNATYSVTFRLADALPATKREELREWRDWWNTRLDSKDMLDASKDDLRKEADEFHRKYGCLLEKFLDAGYGECILEDPEVNRLVFDALKYFDGVRYDLCVFVIMPNHVHVVIKPSNRWELDKILHSWKSYTANEINKLAGGGSGQVWQHESYDRIIRDKDHFENVAKYIWSNAEKAGLDPEKISRFAKVDE